MKFRKFLINALFVLLIGGAIAITYFNLTPAIDYYISGGVSEILTGLVILIGGAFVASFLSVLLHEAGHMLFALFTKFKVISFTLFKTERIYHNGKVIKNRIKNTFSYGSVSLVSIDTENIKRRYLLLTLGGIIISFLLTAAFATLNFLLKGAHPYIYTALCTGFLISLYIFLSSALPSEISGTHTDGAIVIGLIKNRDYAKVLLALIKIQTLLYEGSSPSEIDRDLYFNMPLLSDDHVSMLQVYHYRYLYFLDSGELANAAEADRRLLDFCDVLPVEEVSRIYLNIVFDLICAGGEREKAKATYKFTLDKHDTSQTTMRIRAYYSFYIEKDLHAAKEYLKAARECSDYGPAGIFKMEEKLLDKLQNEMETLKNER